MQKIFSILLLIVISGVASAQDSESSEGGGFRKEMMFTGGNLNFGYFNGVTVLGATPQLGYSIAKWLDAGIVVGYTYTSQAISSNDKVRQSIFGPGAFVRLFPTNFLFAMAQFEQNFIRQNRIFNGTSNIAKTNVSSLLVGLGYTNGRMGRNSPYYYFSVSVDILDNPNSPYRNFANEMFPVVNAGFNIPLFQGSRNRR